MPNSITPSQIGCGWTSVALAVDYKKNCRSRRHGIIRLQFVFGAVCFPRLYIVIGAICYRPHVRRITHLVVVRLAWFLFDVRYSSVLACCRQLVLLVGVVFVVPIVVDSPK